MKVKQGGGVVADTEGGIYHGLQQISLGGGWKL